MDETQLVSFLKKKLVVENITDRCGAVQTEKEIDIDCNIKDWQRLLRTPVERSDEKDPYPAVNCVSNTYVAQPDPFPDFNAATLLTQINQTMDDMFGRNHVIADYTLYTPEQRDHADHIRSRRTIGMADVLLHNQRHQPFYIELFFSSEFSGIVKGLVYCLRFVTPFDDGRNFKKYGRKLHAGWVEPDIHSKYPLAKLGINPTGEFHNCMSVDLPFFFESEEVPHLDNSEIALGLEQLLWGADQLEQKVFGKKDFRIRTHGFEVASLGSHSIIENPMAERELTCEIDSCWEKRERCVIRDFHVSGKSLKGYGRDIFATLTANFNLPALCFYEGSEGFQCRLALPCVDLQAKELDLFERWLGLNQGRFG